MALYDYRSGLAAKHLHRATEIHKVLDLFVRHDVSYIPASHETAIPGSMAITMTKCWE